MPHAPNPAHLQILRTRIAQLGPWRALRLTALKLARRVLLDGAQLHFGSQGEDVLILSLAANYLGKDRFTYVDVGCHEPRRISNSYLAYLQGSSGLAVDLNPAFEAAFRRERPRDVFVCAAVSADEGEAVVHEFAQAEVATIDATQARAWGKTFTPAGTRTMRTVTLAGLVARHLGDARPVDVLMLDVEGHELEVLRGAELARMQPGIVVCEVHARRLSDVASRPVTRFLATANYELVAFAAASAYFVRQDLLEGRP